MRIDLERGGRRPWYMKLGLALAKWVMGVKPGPPLAISYRPDLFHPRMRAYILRGISHRSGAWAKGEAELFAAFTSNLNACHF